MSMGIEAPCQGGEEAGRVPWKKDLLVLSTAIRKARKTQKWTQAEAGKLIGMTERSYRDWENGYKDLPAASLFMLAGALGIRVYVPDAEKNRNDSSEFLSADQAAQVRAAVFGIKDGAA